MPKLKLKIDDLRVESFRTAEAPAGTRGTVQARQSDGTGLYPRPGDDRTAELLCTIDGCFSESCLICQTEPPICLWLE